MDPLLDCYNCRLPWQTTTKRQIKEQSYCSSKKTLALSLRSPRLCGNANYM